MSVNIGSSTGVTTDYAALTNSVVKGKEATTTAPAKQAEATGVIYEKSQSEEQKATYSISKMSPEERTALVEQLKKDQENRKLQLASIVQDMLSKQAGTSKLADFLKGDQLKMVTPEEIRQAQEDVSEDGYWGVKQTSQRLFDFAQALAGDDVDKMKEMQKAMEKGFKKAQEAWGEELPQISKDTLAAANKLFEDYYQSKEN